MKMKKGQERAEIERLRRKSLRKEAGLKLAVLPTNEVAAQIKRAERDFLWTLEWRTLRELVIERYGAKCMCCGAVPRIASRINVDHIKPRKFYPELALDESNLQLLCGRCNKAKGNTDTTDYRMVA